jgi:hypothetical protein
LVWLVVLLHGQVITFPPGRQDEIRRVSVAADTSVEQLGIDSNYLVLF